MVLLYNENEKLIGKSGLGKAIKHQMAALDLEKVPYTVNPKDEYDILHINTYFPKSYLLAKKAKKKGKRIVYHAHSTEEDYRDGFIMGHFTSKIFRKWICKCYSLGDIIITPTPYSKRILEGYKELKGKKIVDISNGIDIKFFKRKKTDYKRLRERYHLAKDAKVVLGIGLYIRRKGIVDFIELARRLSQYTFIWYGYSNLALSTRDVRKAFKNLPQNIIFPGYGEKELIREALGGCDLYLFPTFEETEGIPLIEACGVECNILLRDIPIWDGLVEDGVNVYKAKTISEFEDKIKSILEKKLPSLSGNTHYIAEERDIKNVGKKLRAVYEEVLK